MRLHLSDYISLFFVYLTISPWYAYTCLLLATTVFAWRGLVRLHKILALALWTMILAGFLLILFAQEDTFLLDLALIGAGVAGLTHIMSISGSFLQGKAPILIMTILSPAFAVISLLAMRNAWWEYFYFTTLSFYSSFLFGVLILTVMFFPKAPTWRRLLLVALWPITIVAVLFYGSESVMLSTIPGLIGLTLVLFPAGPLIEGPRISEVLGFIASAIMLLFPLILIPIVLFGGSADGELLFGLVVLGGLGLFGFDASRSRNKKGLLFIGLPLLTFINIIALGASGVALPMLPAAVLFLLSAFTVQAK